MLRFEKDLVDILERDPQPALMVLVDAILPTTRPQPTAEDWKTTKFHHRGLPVGERNVWEYHALLFGFSWR